MMNPPQRGDEGAGVPSALGTAALCRLCGDARRLPLMRLLGAGKAAVRAADGEQAGEGAHPREATFP
jgi:hypothetical protein